ncbi:MAG TPA: hypothetical protein VLM75_09375 [Spirochaetota bacterium]|nr:hypothetical protein [Spirochaetota bacterium]
MRSYIDAVKFIVHSLLGDRLKATVKEQPLGAGDELLDSFVYLPRRKTPRGTILAIHGMAARAHNDPRLSVICRAFSACGYAVVSPLYPDIAGFRIDSGTIDRIVDTVKAVTADKGLCPGGKLSIFAPSFSAGMAMIAASQAEVRDMVDSICSVGTYSNVDSAVEYLLAGQDIDDYGRLIILRNFITHAPGFSKNIPDVLHAGILDNGLHRSVPELPLHLERLSGRERRKLTRLLGEPDFRLMQWQRILERSRKIRKLLRDLSVVSRLEGLRAPVALIHGAEDRVIPPTESILLNDRLRHHKVRSRLVITPLLSHGDISMGLNAIMEILRVVWLFAFFFHHASAREAA